MTKKSFLTYFFVTVMVAGITFLWLSSSNQTSQAGDRTSQQATPSEAPINSRTYKWRGAPEEPKYIHLPTIDSGGYVEKMGIDEKNRVDSPSNIALAGWYKYSKTPGKNGLSIIDGHVDGVSRPGVFYNLKKLKRGDVFTVELGNGDMVQYSVMNLMMVDAAQASKKLFYKDPSIDRQLNLITCGGSFDRSTRSYTKRVIVYSEVI